MTRYLGLMLGRENVLFVCGTDEHGSTSEVAALQAGVPIRQYVDSWHDKQARSMERLSIGLEGADALIEDLRQAIAATGDDR